MSLALYFSVIHRQFLFSLLVMALFFSLTSAVLADLSDPVIPGELCGWFRVESLPYPGEVFFDGESYGMTPVTIKVLPSALPSHDIMIKFNNEDYSQHLTYNPEVGKTVQITLDTEQLNNFSFTDISDILAIQTPGAQVV